MVEHIEDEGEDADEDQDEDDAGAAGDLGIGSEPIEEIEMSILGQEITPRPRTIPNRLRALIHQNFESGQVMQNRLRSNVRQKK